MRGKIIIGDCLEVMINLPDESIDLIVTDPPYGMAFESNRRKVKYGSIDNDNNLSWLDNAAEQMHRVLKDNSHCYVFCSWHNIDTFKQTFQKYFNLKNILIWEKNNTGMGDLKGDYAPKYEMILFLHKGRRLLNGKREPNIIKYARTGNKIHPTQKPVGLIEYLISKSSNENDLVLDPFAGSGTTAEACLNLNRDFILIEINNDYLETVRARLGSFHCLSGLEGGFEFQHFCEICPQTIRQLN